MDEKGYQIGVSGSEKVIVLRRHDGRQDGHAGGVKQGGNRETITCIDCICGNGSVLSPFIIMKGKYVLKQWSEGSHLPPDTHWACSPTGWTNNELGQAWIKVFNEQTRHKVQDGGWRLLILDGHGSHLSFGFLDYAFRNRILVLGLPSHTTDFLQPLDVAIFRPLQRAYAQEVNKRVREHRPVTKDTFDQCLAAARTQAFTRKNILSAFEATGISPLNPWRTTVMQDFRDRFRKSADANADLETIDFGPTSYGAMIAHCSDVLENPLATLDNLRQALYEAIEVVRGMEARTVIVNEESDRLRAALKESKRSKAPRGRVGRAQVYKQSEIDNIGQLEDQRASRTSRTAPTKEKDRTHQPRSPKNSNRSRQKSDASTSLCGQVCTEQNHKQENEHEDETRNSFEVQNEETMKPTLLSSKEPAPTNLIGKNGKKKGGKLKSGTKSIKPLENKTPDT
ncbi:hypothetical protein FRC07_010633, partial [Ceratobasidium sp. 392]